MGKEAYETTYTDFMSLTTAEVGRTFVPRGSFSDIIVVEAGLVIDAMCCHRDRLRATPDGVIDTVLWSAYGKGPYPLEGRLLQPNDETAARLQGIMRKIISAKERPSRRRGAMHYHSGTRLS